MNPLKEIEDLEKDLEEEKEHTKELKKLAKKWIIRAGVSEYQLAEMGYTSLLKGRLRRGSTGLVNNCEICQKATFTCDECGEEFYGRHEVCKGKRVLKLAVVMCTVHKAPERF